MLFSRVLFGLIAVSVAAARKISFNEKQKLYPDKVRMTPFYHEPGAQFPNAMACAKIRAEYKTLDVEAMDQSAIEKLWKLRKVRRVNGHAVSNGLIVNSVYFLAFFQLPLGKASYEAEEFTEAYLTVRHKPGLAFRWYLELDETDHSFRHKKTLKIDENTCKSVFKVQGRPGSIVPLHLMVLGVKQGMLFSTEWAETSKSNALEPLALQFVKLKPARKAFLRTFEIPKLFPVNQPAAGTSTLAPLYATMPISTVEQLASELDKKGHFRIRGYLKVAEGPQVYTLSSYTPVEVRIYTTKVTYTLIAYKGRATRLTLELNPNILYNIRIKGKLYNGDVSGFTFQVHAPRGSIQSSNVELAEISGEKMWPEAFQGEWSRVYTSEHLDDSGSELSEDSGSERGYELQSERMNGFEHEQSDDSGIGQPNDSGTEQVDGPEHEQSGNFETEQSDDFGTEHPDEFETEQSGDFKNY